ncbi:MAG: hypothetical protein J5I50_05235 [Chitinophagaceae bacterium]|nr:hypothetical protein [Chitinophagaceae bacterium]
MKSETERPVIDSPADIVIAHRGAWKNNGHPENSLASLKSAIDAGYYGSETDVHLTDDEQIVVNHDPFYHDIEIQTSMLANLRVFPLVNGEQLPLLSEFLEEIVKQDRTKLILELKPSVRGVEWAMHTVRKVVDEVNKYNAAPHIIYIAFDYKMCLELLRLVPGAEVQYLNGDKTPQQLKDDGISGLDYHHSIFKKHPEYIKQARELGIKTNAWTVNDVETTDWLIKNGIDFITTNEPEMVEERARIAMN